jgi:hypothetical protein
VSPLAAQRQVALAGVALLAIVVALALASLAGGSGAGDGVEARSVPVPGSGWYTALAAPYRFQPDAARTACGHAASPETPGVAHPVLPCGARIVIAVGDRQVLTEVVDRGSGVPGREFDVTEALADHLGLEGVQEIRWRFAR